MSKLNNGTLITIGRTFGSGGREIGKKLAERLGIPFYDKELLEIVASESGVFEDIVVDLDEKPTYSFLYSLVMNTSYQNHTTANTEFAEDRIEKAQKRILEHLAEKGSCVIIGRRADLVLRNRFHILSVFISAPEPYRIERVSIRDQLTPEESRKKIRRMDKQRASYYNYYGDGIWGNAANYSICLNSAKFGVDGCVKLIEQALNCDAD